MINKIISIAKLPFSAAVDTSTSSGRSQQRHIRIARTAITGIIARLINIVTGLATVPLTLSHLGSERFGLWMTLTSFVAFLSFTDLGLGIGLQNALSKCDGTNDHVRPKGLVSSALFVMCIIALSLVVIALFVLPFFDLADVIKVNEEATREAILPTAQAVIVAFAFGLPCGLIQRVYNAYQRGYWGNILLAFGRVLGFVGVLFCVWFKLSLPILAFAMMGIPFISLATGSVFLFHKTPYLRPSIRSINKSDIKLVFSIGLIALGAQIASTLMASGPAIVIANRIGADSVTSYSITQRLLGLTGIVLSVMFAPLWPAYGEATARGDMAWVKKTFKRSLKIAAVIATPVFIVVSFYGQTIIKVWAGDSNAVPSFSLLMSCNVWALIMVWNRISATLLNGLNCMAGQAIYGNILAVCAISCGYFLGSKYSVAGIVWSIVIVGEVSRGSLRILDVWFAIRKRSMTQSCPDRLQG